MDRDRDKQYRTQEFAELAGVTVRTLHHYDRLGLLRPRRTRNGYRVYCDRDLERLEQVVALKFVGIPLKQIKALLGRDAPELVDALRMQRRMLLAKRRQLDDAIEAIGQAESEPNTAVLKKIIEVIEMQNDTDWMLKYHNDAAKAKIVKRRQLWSPELQERVSREWMQLIGDVEAALTEDPKGETGQALAERWISLVEEFTAGDPDVTDGVRNLYADSHNWPTQFKEQMQRFRISREAGAFISKAIERGRGNSL